MSDFKEKELNTYEENNYFKFKKDKTIREKIFLSYVDVIEKIISLEFFEYEKEMEDLYSEGRIALLECIDNYGWDSQISFFEYVLENVRTRVKKQIENNQKFLKCNHKECEDRKVESLENIYLKKELIAFILRELHKFSPRDRVIFYKYYGVFSNKKYSFKELSKTYFVSESRLRKIKTEKFLKIKERLILHNFLDESECLKRRKVKLN